MALLGASSYQPDRGASGGLGFITTQCIHPNGTTWLCTGDVWGASEWDETTQTWEQVLRADLMPAGDVGPDRPSNSGKVDFLGGYCYEAAPSDASRKYLGCNGFLYKRDGSAPFVRLGMPAQKMYTNTGSARLWQGRLAIDPTNKDKFVLATMEGARYSTNGGTDNCPAVSGIGAPPDLPDTSPAMNLTCVNSDGTKWCIFEQGVGAKISTTGPGGTYSTISGSPLYAREVQFDAAGYLHVIVRDDVETSNNWHYHNGTSWTRPSMPGTFNAIFTLAIDPADVNSCVGIIGSGQAWISTDRGVNYVGSNVWNQNYPSPIGVYLNSPYTYKGGNKMFFPSSARFAPTGQPYRLRVTDGVGCRRSTPPATFSRWDWQDCSAAKTGNVGLNMLVCNRVLTVPGDSQKRAYEQKWDWAFWDVADVSRANPDYQNPSTDSLSHAWDADYALDDLDYIAVNINFGTGRDKCGYYQPSTRTYTRFAARANVDPYGGALALSDKNRIIMVDAGGGGTLKAEFSRVGGIGAGAWSGANGGYLTLNGVEQTDWIAAYYTRRYPIARDHMQAGRFYCINPNVPGLWRKIIGTSAAGDSDVKVFTGNVVPGFTDSSGQELVLRCVPGTAGKVMLSVGRYASSGYGLYVFQDNLLSGGSASATRTAVPNVTDVISFGFGKAARGRTNPSIFFYGKLSGVRGFYWSYDDMATWMNFGTEFPLSHCDNVSAVDGDMNIFGRCHIGFSGSNGIVRDLVKSVTLT